MTEKMINVNIRMNDDTKSKFEEFCESVGMTMTSAFNLFAKTVVNEQRIPFEIRSNKYNNLTMKVLDDALDGKNMSKSYDNMDDFWESLDV